MANFRFRGSTLRNGIFLVAYLVVVIASAIPPATVVAGETVTGPDGNSQSLEASVVPSGLYENAASPAS